MIFNKCPFCKITVNCVYSHIRFCKSKDKNLSKDEIDKEVYFFNIPEIMLKFPEESKHMSLPDFKKKYNLQYKQTEKIYDILKINKRTIKESNNLPEKKKKIEKTNLERYGDVNVLGKKSPLYKKRNETVKKKYGVNNVFQFDDIKNKISSDEFWISKYGLTFGQLQSKKMKKLWNNLTDDDKTNWLKKSLWSNSSSCVSSLEKKVVEKFLELNFSLETQKMLKNKILIKNSRKTFYYDIYLKNINLLVEINGDYWHANPAIYNKNDIIHIGNKDFFVKDIWDFDKEKTDNAKQQGYNIITLWEGEITKNRKIVDNFKEIFLEKINENKIY